MADVKEIMDELSTVLQTIESSNGDLAYEVATFIDEELLDEDDLSTYSLALQYAKWAMTHPNKLLGDDARYSCKCYRGSKWNVDTSTGTLLVRPCDRCSPRQYRYWTAGFVGDSDLPPV